MPKQQFLAGPGGHTQGPGPTALNHRSDLTCHIRLLFLALRMSLSSLELPLPIPSPKPSLITSGDFLDLIPFSPGKLLCPSIPSTTETQSQDSSI